MMAFGDKLLHEIDTEYGHYQVWDMVYAGRPARVLFSGRRQAAQSGIAKDDKLELLFDYNQRFYELVSSLMPQRILLIGGGVYTLPTALLKTSTTLTIDVIEIDPGLDDIAEAFFDVPNDDRLQIIHEDGWEYINRCEAKYDAILLDAFSGLDMPNSLHDVFAAQRYKELLGPGGFFAMNSISAYEGRGAEVIEDQLDAFLEVFPNVSVFLTSRDYTSWTPQNLLLVAEADMSYPLSNYLRYPAIRLGSA